MMYSGDVLCFSSVSAESEIFNAIYCTFWEPGYVHTCMCLYEDGSVSMATYMVVSDAGCSLCMFDVEIYSTTLKAYCGANIKRMNLY